MLLRNKSLSHYTTRFFASMVRGATKTLRQGLAFVSGLGASFKWAFWPTTPKYKLGQLIQVDKNGALGAITYRKYTGKWYYRIDGETIHYSNYMIREQIEKYGDPGVFMSDQAMGSRYIDFLREWVFGDLNRNMSHDWDVLFGSRTKLTYDISSAFIIVDLPKDLSHKYHDLLKKYGIRGKNYMAPIEYETVEMRLP